MNKLAYYFIIRLNPLFFLFFCNILNIIFTLIVLLSLQLFHNIWERVLDQTSVLQQLWNTGYYFVKILFYPT